MVNNEIDQGYYRKSLGLLESRDVIAHMRFSAADDLLPMTISLSMTGVLDAYPTTPIPIVCPGYFERLIRNASMFSRSLWMLFNVTCTAAAKSSL